MRWIESGAESEARILADMMEYGKKVVGMGWDGQDPCLLVCSIYVVLNQDTCSGGRKYDYQQQRREYP